MKFGRAPTTCATVSAMIPFPMGRLVDACAVAFARSIPESGRARQPSVEPTDPDPAAALRRAIDDPARGAERPGDPPAAARRPAHGRPRIAHAPDRRPAVPAGRGPGSAGRPDGTATAHRARARAALGRPAATRRPLAAERVGRSPSTATRHGPSVGPLVAWSSATREPHDAVLAALSVGDDSARLLLQAEIDWQLGRYRRTAEGRRSRLLELRPGDREAARLLAWARSELTVLTPGWRPGAGPTRSIAPVKGRVLHLLTNSLPYRQAGYTVRVPERRPLPARGRASIRRWRPGPASRAPTGSAERPLQRGRRGRDLPPPALPTSSPAPVRRRRHPDGSRPQRQLVERLRPAVLHPATNYLNGQVGAGAPRPLRDSGRLRGARLPRGDLAVADRRRTSPTATATGRLATSRPPACATLTPSSPCPRRCGPTSSGAAATDPDRVVVVPNARGCRPGSCRDPRDDGARRPARARSTIRSSATSRASPAMRGSATSSRPPPSSAAGRRVRACSSGTARSGPRSRTRRRAAGVDDGTVDLHRPRPARRRPRLLPPHRRLRRAAHERPGLAARHAAQALRGDGDGAGARRERGRRPARDRRPTARRVASFRPEDPVGLADVAGATCSTIRPSAPGSVRPPGPGSSRTGPGTRTERGTAPSTSGLASHDGRPAGGATSADRLPHVLDRPVRFADPADGRVGGRARLRRGGLCPLGAGAAARVGGRRLSDPARAGDRPAGDPGSARARAPAARRSVRRHEARHSAKASGRGGSPTASRNRRGVPGRRQLAPTPTGSTASRGSLRGNGLRVAAPGAPGRLALGSMAPADRPVPDPAGRLGGGRRRRRRAGRRVARHVGRRRSRRSSGCAGDTAAEPSTTAETSTSTPGPLSGMAAPWTLAHRWSRASLGAPLRCASSPSTTPTPRSWRASSGSRPRRSCATRPGVTTPRRRRRTWSESGWPCRPRPRSSSTRAGS